MNSPTLLAAAVAVIATATTLVRDARAADRIYHNGTILTLDRENRIVESVAVRDATIAACGTLEEVRKQVDPSATRVDLKGRTLLPGFYAAHDHFLNASIAAAYYVDLNSPPIGRIETLEDLLTALRERAAVTRPGEWVVGRGYDDTLIREHRHPTRHDLDRVSTAHPIWITHTSGHLGVANSRALAAARITRETANPPNGVIHREAGSSEPNGVFEECGSLISRHVPARTQSERLAAMRAANRVYLGKGVTTSVIAGGPPQSITDLEAAVERGFVDVRLVVLISGGTNVSNAVLTRAKPKVDSERLRIGGIKLYQDGSIQGYTGYLTQPYHVQPPGKTDYRGYALRSRESLLELVTKYHRGGHQVAIHGNGDAAIDDILFAFAEAQRAHPRADARHRIEHCQTPREDQLKRMKELGVSPSFFVGHVFYWGDRHRELFLGLERAARISPLRSARDQGLRFSVHNDTPVTPVDPLLLVWAAVNRETRHTRQLGAEQRISVLEALRAVTSDAAWQNFEDERKGSIEPGKLADFVVLAENPLGIRPERIRSIEIIETIVGGRSVYHR